MKSLPVWEPMKNHRNYKTDFDRLSGEALENQIATECHAYLTGVHGNEILAKMRDVVPESVVDRVKKWLNDCWKAIKSAIDPWTSQEIQEMSLEDFVNMPLADLVKGIPIGNELKEIAKRNDEARHAKQELRKKAALKYHSELNAKLKPYHVRIDAKGDLAWLSQNPSHKERMHYAEKEDEVWKIIDEYVARYEAEASNTTPTNRKFSISGEKNLDAQEGKSDNKGEVTDIKGTSKFQRFVQIIFIN